MVRALHHILHTNSQVEKNCPQNCPVKLLRTQIFLLRPEKRPEKKTGRKKVIGRYKTFAAN
jgi:hypothetical protein